MVFTEVTLRTVSGRVVDNLLAEEARHRVVEQRSWAIASPAGELKFVSADAAVLLAFRVLGRAARGHGAPTKCP